MALAVLLCDDLRKLLTWEKPTYCCEELCIQKLHSLVQNVLTTLKYFTTQIPNRFTNINCGLSCGSSEFPDAAPA
jgi:hypothetical protein